jgi:hypothetical protein
MAFKVKFSVAALFSPVKRLLQKATFWGLPVLALVLAVLLWHSGGREAEHAFNDGRRLLITVNGGVITGKQATPETIKEMAKAAAEKLAAEKKAAEEKDKAAKEAEAKAAKEAEKSKTEISKPEEPKTEESNGKKGSSGFRSAVCLARCQYESQPFGKIRRRFAACHWLGWNDAMAILLKRRSV